MTWKGIEILYEDNHLLIVRKPQNMPTQADASGDSSLNEELKGYLKSRYDKPGNVYLGLVHRLDRPVGGIVALAKTGKAAERLSLQVQTKKMHRTYLALVWGNPESSGRLRDILFKDARTNTVRVVEEGFPGGKEAKLSYRRIARNGELSLVEVTLETGRSHQIRVQLSHAGLPIWGDARYGQGKPGEQIALYGAFLSLVHPTLKKEMHFMALPPVSMRPWDRFESELLALREEKMPTE